MFRPRRQIGYCAKLPDQVAHDEVGCDDLAERTIKAVIPGRSNRRVKIDYDRALYRQRNRMERMFGHLKINRAIATRYDQLANSFLGMVHIAPPDTGSNLSTPPSKGGRRPSRQAKLDGRFRDSSRAMSKRRLPTP